MILKIHLWLSTPFDTIKYSQTYLRKKNMQVKQWIENLQRDFKPDDYVCVHIWQADDIKAKASEMKLPFELTDDDVENILIELEDNIDSSLGVSWVTVESQIEVYVENDPRSNPQDDDETEV